MESPSTTVPNGLDVIQGMIDISADRLEGLRTQCATSAVLTQQEIRSLETKLVRMFAELLITKAKLPERIPANGLAASGTELKQWLRVVGLSSESLNVCLQRLNTLEQLLEKSDTDLRDLVAHNLNYRDEEVRRLTSAMENLRKCTDALKDGNREPENLFWDSWDRHHHAHHHHHHRGSTGNIGVTASPRSNRGAITKQKTRQSPINNNPTDQHPVVQSPSSITTPEEVHGSIHTIHTLTPSPSPPNSPCLTSGSGTSAHKVTHRKTAGTPPPKKKHQTHLTHNPPTPSHMPNSMTTSTSSSSSQDPLAPIAKSKSHDSQLQENPGALAASSASNAGAVQSQTIPRTRLHTDPSPDSSTCGGGINDIIIENTNNLTVPRSPCTPIVPLGMGHMIAHRFTKVFKMLKTCDLCQKQMFFGLKCKECKYRCHKDCEPSVPPSCGLPREFVDEFIKTLSSNETYLPPPNTSPNLSTIGRGSAGLLTAGRRQKPQATSHHPDSSSPGSSCNSSSPSSPALFNMQQHGLGSSSTSTTGGSSTKILTPSSAHKHVSQFNFPEVTITSLPGDERRGSTSNHSQHNSPSDGQNNADNSVAGHHHHHHQHLHHPQTTSITITSSNCSSVCVSTTLATSGNFSTLAGRINRFNGGIGLNQMRPGPPLSELSDTHKSNDSDKTVSLSGSTSASTDSDRTPVRLDSTEEGDSGNWPRQNSLSLKEWDIPYDDLRLLEKIGKGRFGTVHRALWHGDVAVKLLKEDYLQDERTLEAFKLEVANFKKTRHENLVLFMGACMNPPYLAIVTSLCKGNTLYTYIHSRRDKFTINRTTLVAQQISQGMGYLHARGIFHKDLRTKNIFLENGKVIITDFGLFSSTKLLYCDMGLGVPNSWLCYLAPELMRALQPRKPTDEILPFSKASDVYSFGTVWYELLCGEFPFKIHPPEAIIWQVGRGMKQTLANLQTSRDVKDILMLCWSFQADDRPDFQKLLTLLERLPKKRLARSPSHPVQLSRSAESVF